MKAKLIFDLDDNSDDMALKRCHKSLAMALVLFELTYNTKKKIIYKALAKELTNDDIIDLIFTEINGLMEEHSINIDELVE